MIRLAQIEWFKIRNHRFFWIGMGLFAILVTTTLGYFGKLSLFGTGRQPDPEDMNMVTMMIPANLEEAGFYTLPFIWQNTTYIASFFKFIPAFLLLFFMSSEFEYRTYRQNIIDGLSVTQFFFSKLMTVFAFALMATLVVGLTVSLLAIYHNEEALSGLGEQSSFLLAYFAEVFSLLSLAFLFGILVRRSAIAIIILMIYYVMEPALGYYLGEPIKEYLPTRPSRDMINEPFTRLFNIQSFLNVESPDSVNWKLFSLSLVYSFIFAGTGLFILRKRDL